MKKRENSENSENAKISKGKVKVTLQEWILNYLQEYKKNELKVSTYSSYIAVYRKHIAESGDRKVGVGKVVC